MVALIAAGETLQHAQGGPRGRTTRERARLARDLEARLMGLPTGMQDHYAALKGGAQRLEWLPGGERVERLVVDLGALRASLIVAYTGVSHFSAGNNWRIVRRRLDGSADSGRVFAAIADVAPRCAGALSAGDLAAVGRLMREEWSHRRRLARGVTTKEIERLLSAARRLGAWGGKACGAGGGGCVAILAPAERRVHIERELLLSGATLLRAAPTARGLVTSLGIRGAD
jgi:D-glycero-alpha-D-manno-heptose-7-phosphate kinase